MNLAVYARDAMPLGGQLVLETSNVHLDEEYARRHVGVSPGEHVMLTVSNTGCGIAPDVLPPRRKARGPGWACPRCTES